MRKGRRIKEPVGAGFSLRTRYMMKDSRRLKPAPTKATNMSQYSMKILIARLFVVFSDSLHAQGGMGKLPREDVVMLSQVVRDSLSDEMFARISDLKRFALANNLDSAAPMIAWNGGKTKEGRW